MDNRDKVDYVLSEARKKHPFHECHWPKCSANVPPAMYMCKTHWFKLPKAIRDGILAVYEPGQEISKDPSEAYIEMSELAQKWIRENYPNG